MHFSTHSAVRTSTRVHENDFVRDFCKKMMALAMVLLDKVLSSYNDICAHAETLSDAPSQLL